ncbi:hypothetical protein KPSB59_1510003 [Klebsiella quasipneumoniae subsp. quasipneumoniae]|nr:hypothetical protein KPSB59_1510003 [Klebsiella quasipneumoniae subsp. quasipneumoniae]
MFRKLLNNNCNVREFGRCEC